MPASNPTGRNKLTPQQYEQLDELLRQKPATGMPDWEIAQKVGCTAATVRNRRKALAAQMKKGRKRESIRQAITAGQVVAADLLETGGEGSDRKDAGAHDILAAFPDARVLTPEESMKLVSILLQNNPPPSAVPGLVNALSNLRDRYAPPDEVGPPPPSTPKEQLDWLVVILDAAGPGLVAKAIDRLWPGLGFHGTGKVEIGEEIAPSGEPPDPGDVG